MARELLEVRGNRIMLYNWDGSLAVGFEVSGAETVALGVRAWALGLMKQSARLTITELTQRLLGSGLTRPKVD
jgi:hypothetical protein